MAYEIRFDAKVLKTISKWKRSHPQQFKKLVKIIISIGEDPRRGLGHPEPLVGGEGMTYSRRISAHDRIIYRIHDQEIYVLVIELEGHYDDK